MSNWARLLAVCGVALALLAPASAAPAALHLGARARRHIQEGHFPGGRRTAGKSLFNKGEDLDALIAAAASAPARRERNGRLKRVYDVGRPVGVNDRTGQAVSTVVVIAEPDGEVVTAYPGR
jgi:hypothetical protein